MAHRSQTIKMFTVNSDGEITPIDMKSLSEFDQTAVYIIVNEMKRKIYIWKGESAPVRTKFISAKTAQAMRQKDYGMVFRIESLDPGLEGSEFLAIFSGGAPSSQEQPSPVQQSQPQQHVPTYSQEAERAAKISSQPTTTESVQPATRTTPRRAPSRAPTSAVRTTSSVTTTAQPPSRSSSMDTIKERPTTPSTSRPSQPPVSVPTETRPAPETAPSARPVVHRPKEVVVTGTVQPTPQISINDVVEILKELEIPDDMEREIVVIGNSVFSVIRERLRLFEKEVLKLEIMEDLPDGVFPASDYQTRLFMKDGKVLFLEFLRRKTKSEREEFIDDIKKSLKDLTSLGI